MDNTGANKGLQGLGVLNDNYRPTLESPYGFLQKNDVDIRKLITVLKELNTCDKFTAYLKNWFGNTGVTMVEPCDENFKQLLKISDIFYTRVTDNLNNGVSQNVFCILGCISPENVRTIAQLLVQSGLTTTNVKMVAIGVFNCNKETKDIAKQANMEVIELEDIYEINSAIDSGDRQIPYFSLNMNCFKAQLAKALNTKYVNETKQKTGGMVNQVSSSLENTANGLFGDLKNSLTEGFNQLKESVNGVVSSVQYSAQANQLGATAGAVGIGMSQQQNLTQEQPVLTEYTQSNNDNSMVMAQAGQGMSFSDKASLVKEQASSENGLGAVVGETKGAYNTSSPTECNITPPTTTPVSPVTQGVTLTKSKAANNSENELLEDFEVPSN